MFLSAVLSALYQQPPAGSGPTRCDGKNAVKNILCRAACVDVEIRRYLRKRKTGKRQELRLLCRKDAGWRKPRARHYDRIFCRLKNPLEFSGNAFILNDMFEHRSKPVISQADFTKRVLGWFFITLCLLSVSLLTGVAGYHYFESMPWLDAFLNAAMILGGMGEISPLQTVNGKIFAAVYAIYCGLFLLVCGGLLLAPVFHRVLHRFHADR